MCSSDLPHTTLVIPAGPVQAQQFQSGPAGAVVLEELIVLEEPPARLGPNLGAQAQAHTRTFASTPELGHTIALASRRSTIPQDVSASLEIRIRPALTSPLSWLAVALGKQYKLDVDSVQLGTLDGVQIKLCPVTATGVVNLADPHTQLVLSASACATAQPKSMLVNDIEST